MKRFRRPPLLALVLSVAASLAIAPASSASGPLRAAAGGAAASSTAVVRTATQVPSFRHVFVVMMENLDYATAMETPALAALAKRYAVATRYYAVAHPSLPNYLAISAGSTFGISSDCVDCFVNAPNLFSQLAAKKLSFDGFFEGLTTSCDLAPYAGLDYAGKHNPFRYFDDVRSSRALCAHLLPASRLAPLLSGAPSKVPRFVWYTPNLCDDGHDCPPATAAAWLTRFVGEVTRSAAWKQDGVLFVTWDESNGSDFAVEPPGKIVGSGGGGQVMTLVIAPGVQPGLRVSVPYNHYSLLATVEDGLGLPLLKQAKTATPMSAFFAKR